MSPATLRHESFERSTGKILACAELASDLVRSSSRVICTAVDLLCAITVRTRQTSRKARQLYAFGLRGSRVSPSI